MFCAAHRQRAELDEARALHRSSAQAHARFTDNVAQTEQAKAQRERDAAAQDYTRHQASQSRGKDWG